MKTFITLGLFVLATVAIGSAIGILTAPGDWYAGLAKPSFNPPNQVFGPVWTVLYIMIAVAGWLVWRAAPHSPAMALWAVQMLLNWLWSPVFFSLQSPGWAMLVIVLLLAAILGFIATAYRIDGRASGLFVPYALWVGFASVLNASIWWLN